MSLFNFSSSDTLMPFNDANKISFNESNNVGVGLEELDSFPEPPSISLDEIQELNDAFNNIYSPSTENNDKIKIDLSPKSGSNSGIEEFNDASSTLDRPVLKKLGIKRTETLDIDNDKKPSLPCTSPPALSETSNETLKIFPYPTEKLKVDPIKLSESLKLINNNRQQQKTSTLSTSKSTIERPRSTGSPYQLFSVYKN
uniref:Uncharacterized protein n=1 Tax=Panagrolaimus sp. PS1159 TaxID=55785 RepID=A0AC35FY88_9BILA